MLSYWSRLIQEKITVFTLFLYMCEQSVQKYYSPSVVLHQQ